MILEFREVDFFREALPILKKVSCEIRQGESLALLGPSGSGKTTFLRLCAGLEQPTAGSIYLRGQLVADGKFSRASKLRHIGFVFQNYALFEMVSVKKNIFYGCKSTEDFAEGQRLIDSMDLGKHLDKLPSQLSGGERQKVALARSLALKPDLILLDEPFASIDTLQTDFLIDEMKILFTTLGVTALLVTHSEQEAERFSTRILRFPLSPSQMSQ